jgi:DNA-binding CsgD family transcriptional regulator
MQSTDSSLGPLDIPEPALVGPALALYEHAVLLGRLDEQAAYRDLPLSREELATARRTLLRLGVLSASGDVDKLLPVHPDQARGLLNGPLAEAISAREHLIAENNRQLQRISDELAEVAMRSPGGGAGVRWVGESSEVRRELDAALLGCTVELITVQPGGGALHERLVSSTAADLALLERGVARRQLFQHTAQANLQLRSHVRQVTAHGGEVRTSSESFEGMVVVDRRTVFLGVDPVTHPGQAAVVAHPALVPFLHRVVENLWAGAMPFDAAEEQYYEAADETKVALLRLMASGLKDEAIANRLGMATRTARRHMAAIMDELGATSRFQAGVKIARMGILSSQHDTRPVARADDSPLW